MQVSVAVPAVAPVGLDLGTGAGTCRVLAGGAPGRIHAVGALVVGDVDEGGARRDLLGHRGSFGDGGGASFAYRSCPRVQSALRDELRGEASAGTSTDRWSVRRESSIG